VFEVDKDFFHKKSLNFQLMFSVCFRKKEKQISICFKNK
jgi:hypothetical protein